MTFDRAVRCRWDDVSLAGSTDGHVLTPADKSLLEVKCASGMPLWLADFLSEEGIFKASFSKYGAAVSYQMGVRQLYVDRSRMRHARRPRHSLEVFTANHGMAANLAACV
jgi:hypothetical protein